jgi:hypothetical protein
VNCCRGGSHCLPNNPSSSRQYGSRCTLTVNTRDPDANGDVTLAVGDIEGAVSDEIEINGHPLTENITLTAEDLDAVSSDGGDVNGPLVIITDGAGLILENITSGKAIFIQAKSPGGADFLWFMGYRDGGEDFTIQNYAANNFFYLKSDGTIQLDPSAGKPVSIGGQVVPSDYGNFDSRYSANLTYLPPDPTQEEILRANTARYDRLLVAAAAAAFPLQSAMALGTITPEQQTMLTALQNFSIDLVDTDLTKSPVKWPPLPAGIKLPLI